MSNGHRSIHHLEPMGFNPPSVKPEGPQTSGAGGHEPASREIVPNFHFGLPTIRPGIAKSYLNWAQIAILPPMQTGTRCVPKRVVRVHRDGLVEKVIAVVGLVASWTESNSYWTGRGRVGILSGRFAEFAKPIVDNDGC